MGLWGQSGGAWARGRAWGTPAFAQGLCLRVTKAAAFALTLSFGPATPNYGRCDPAHRGHNAKIGLKKWNQTNRFNLFNLFNLSVVTLPVAVHEVEIGLKKWNQTNRSNRSNRSNLSVVTPPVAVHEVRIARFSFPRCGVRAL